MRVMEEQMKEGNKVHKEDVTAAERQNGPLCLFCLAHLHTNTQLYMSIYF